MERATIALDVILGAIKVENMTIKDITRYFGILFCSLTRYCSIASDEDVRGISQNLTFSIGTVHLAR
jgi:hypothetical protein